MSIQTINGSIISNYPVFEGSQVLTSEQLNGMFDYLDQQNRFTRSRLIGIGIVCGLDIQTVKNQVVLSEGIGITSDGFIIKMPECTMSYQRDYFLPSTVAYEAFGSYDSDNIFTQDDDIILYELLSKKPAEGHHQNLTADFLDDKYMLIFLECFDRDPRSCLGKNCEDLGKERIFTTRKLAVDKKGLNRILSKTNGSVENPFFPTSELKRVDLKKPVFDPDGEESKELKSFVMHIKALLYESGNPECVHHLLFGQGEGTGLIQATYPEYQPLLEPAYNYQDPFLTNTQFNKVKSALRSYLAGGTVDNLKGVQDVYEFYELLIDTYHELMDVGAMIAQECCPHKDFSLHLILGKIVWDESKEIDELDLLGQSRYRHQFLQPKILNSQAVLLKELISLHHKLLLLVESFQINIIKEKSVSGIDETIKITPLDPDAGAIPRYLMPDQKGSVQGILTTDLETQWDFETTVTGKHPIRIRSYDRNEITHATLNPVKNDFVGAPLHYRTSLSTYKAEAIFGEELEKVVKGESEIRDQYHLPFTILPVKINPNPDSIIVEPRYWQDLQTAYNMTKGEINVTFKNLIGHLKEFERAAAGVNYGLTTVNMHNFKSAVDQVLGQISIAGGLADQANELVIELPVRIEDFYDNGASPNPFQAYYALYRTFRRNLHQAFLQLWNANEILIREKIEVLDPTLFQMWKNWTQWPSLGIKDFLSNNDFFQLHKLYYSFVVRYQFLQQNHYSILCNFLRLHPGIDFNAIRNDGTHILIYNESSVGTDGEKDQIVFANFTLPYRLDPDQIDIPLDDELEEAKLPPLARGESILLEKGQQRRIDILANDLEPNGGTLRVDSKGSVNASNIFDSGVSINGAKVVNDGGVNSVLRYESKSGFDGFDHFQYTIESELDASLQDVAYVEVLVVPPYRKHIRAIDDLAATNNHHSVTISILDNDTDYPGTKVILPAKSAFGADLTLLSDNRVMYKPVYGREGKDTFSYTLQYEFMTDAGPQVEVSEAEVEVIVFCCNRMEFEVLCEGNEGEFKVLTEREREEEAKLTLINEDGEPVEKIETSEFHFIEVRESGGVPYLFYQPDIYFKGKETYVYEVTDSEGFMRRVKLEILVMPCAKTYLRRVLRDTITKFHVLETGQSDVFVYEDRNTPVSGAMRTMHGEVETDGLTLKYFPDAEYVGLDFFEFGYQDDQGMTHYNTMQIIVDGTEKVHVESTFQDTPATFNVLSDEMLSSGYELRLYLNKGDLLNEIDSGDGRLIEVDGGDIRYTPKTSFIGDDSFHYVILKGGFAFEYGKFFVIVDTNRKVQVEYTLRDLPKDIQVMTADQADAGGTLAISTTPAIPGADAEVIVPASGAPFVRYTPANSYVGQDSFGYVITVGEVKLYGTVYVIVDSNERIELVNVYKNKPKEFQLFDASQDVSEFDILEAPTHGSLTQLPGNVLQYFPEDDYTGTDKMKYRARVGGSIQYGTVFFIVTCECKDIMVTGTVSENAPTFPTIDNVRVEEIGTGKHVFTGASGVFSIQVAPNARLRFTKQYYESLEDDVAYRSTLNVQMDRQEVAIKGMVTNADTNQPLSDVSVVNQRGTTFTDSNGDYSLVVYAGSRIDYFKNGFISENRTAGTNDGSIDVAMKPNTVKVAGEVVDVAGKPITNAYFEFDSTVSQTDSGTFSLDVPEGTSITFGAEGYDSQVYLADVNREGLRIVLNRSVVTIHGTVPNVATGEPLEAVNISDGLTQLQTDAKGYFEFDSVPGLTVEFSKKGFYMNSAVVHPNGGGMLVPLAPVPPNTEVTVSGTVYEDAAGELVTLADASYELEGQVYTTSKGNFSFTAVPGSTVIFMAPDFQNQPFTVPGHLNDAQVVLNRKGLDDQGPKVSVSGHVYEDIAGDLNVIPDASYEMFGQENATSKGAFSFTVDIGSNVMFMAPGFQNQPFQVTAPLSGAKVVLQRSANEPVEDLGDREITGTITVNGVPTRGQVTSVEKGMVVSTDNEGRYSIVTRPGDNLIFRADGFKITQEREVRANSTVFNVEFDLQG